MGNSMEEAAAARIGLSVEEYKRRICLGLKYCWRCRNWLTADSGFRVGSSMCKDCRAGLGRQHREAAVERGEGA